MTVIVTGGAGFLGRHLVQLLLDRDRDVVAVDSLWTGSMENLRNFENEKRFRYILEPLPFDEHVEEIYHLACPASPDHFEKSPIEILDTCYRGTKNVLELAVKNSARILLASTSEVYGDPTVSTQPETYFGNVNCFGPRSCYDEGKRVAEALAFAYRSQHGLDVRVARIFNAYGPYMSFNDGRAVPNFITAAMEGKPISIYGDGRATRCFQFAADCVAGLVGLMGSSCSTPVNIGSDLEIPVGEIAYMVAKVVAAKTGRDKVVPINLLPKRQDDPVRRRPDTTVAREVLGWRPKVSLEQGIAMTVDWFLERHGQARNGDMARSRPAL